MKLVKNLMAVAVISTTATFSFSDDLVMTTGSPGGSYVNIGKITKGLATQYKLDIELSESMGSIENIERVAEGEAAIGLAQADVYKEYLNANSPSNLKIMTYLKEECLFLVGRKGGKVDGPGSLQQKGVKVDVGDMAGGTSGSWSYIERLEDKYKRVQKFYDGHPFALMQVISGDVDASVFVTAPGYLNHESFKIINSNPDLVWLDFNDWDLNDELDGKPVYTFRDVVVEKGTFFDTKVEIPCTKLLVFFNTDLVEGKDKNNLAKLFLNNPNSFK